VVEGRQQGIEKDVRQCMAVVDVDEVMVKGDIQWDAQTILKPRFLICWNQSVSICLFLVWSGTLWHNATWIFIPLKSEMTIS